MTAPLVIDTHMHIYRSAEDAARAKASYQIWEYGSRPGVHFSAYGGDPDDARAAMVEAGASHAVAANLLDAPTPGVDPRQDLLTYNRVAGRTATRDGQPARHVIDEQCLQAHDRRARPVPPFRRRPPLLGSYRIPSAVENGESADVSG